MISRRTEFPVGTTDKAALEGSILHHLSNHSAARLFSLRQGFSSTSIFL
jgi:hypothetical protein